MDGTAGRARARLKLVVSLAMVVTAIMGVGYQLWMHGTTPVLAAVRFEVRLAEDEPIPGLVVARLGGAGIIYLHPEIVVSNDDIAQSWVSEDAPNQFGVGVRLLASGAERMRQATATHVGRPVAILIDGRVVMVSVLRSPIGDEAVITGIFTRAEAERIADGMKLR